MRTPQNKDTGEVTVPASDRFAWLRTRMAVERTALAWTRTAVSLIGFGFTIVLFFESVNDIYEVGPAIRPLVPRLLGLSLILLGVVTLIICMADYWKTNRYLRSSPFETVAASSDLPRRTPLTFVAFTLAMIGAFCAVAIYLRLI